MVFDCAALERGAGIFLSWAVGQMLRSPTPNYAMVSPWVRLTAFLAAARGP